MECSVCFKVKFITPCGAPNNCTASVCKECKFNPDQALDLDYFTPKCFVCREREWHTGLIEEVNMDIFDNNGAELNTKKYIIFLQQIKNGGWEHCYDDIDFCIPCEE